MASVYLTQASGNRRGIDIVPLAELDELSPTARDIWSNLRNTVLSSLGDPTSTLTVALDDICDTICKENEMQKAVDVGITRRRRHLRLRLRVNNPEESGEHESEHEESGSDEEELAIC